MSAAYRVTVTPDTLTVLVPCPHPLEGHADPVRPAVVAHAGSRARYPEDWPTDQLGWIAQARRTAADAETELSKLDPGEHFDHPDEVAALEQLAESRRRAAGWCEGCDGTRRELARWRAGTHRPRYRALWCQECAAEAVRLGLTPAREDPT